MKPAGINACLTGWAIAALCYAEFAAMVPVAGSAYTYSYAPLREIWAWIIGWDFFQEYSVAVAAVAIGWSGYVVNLLRDEIVEAIRSNVGSVEGLSVGPSPVRRIAGFTAESGHSIPEPRNLPRPSGRQPRLYNKKLI